MVTIPPTYGSTTPAVFVELGLGSPLLVTEGPFTFQSTVVTTIDVLDGGMKVGHLSVEQGGPVQLEDGGAEADVQRALVEDRELAEAVHHRRFAQGEPRGGRAARR